MKLVKKYCESPKKIQKFLPPPNRKFMSQKVCFKFSWFLFPFFFCSWIHRFYIEKVLPLLMPQTKMKLMT